MKRLGNVKHLVLLGLVLFLLGCLPYDVAILAPLDGATFDAGVKITFTGFAKDIIDGKLTGDSLVWTTEPEGEIGKGEEFTKDDLVEGVHTITLTATNSKGESTTDTITITISKGIPPTTSTTSSPNSSTSTTIEPDDRLESNCYNWPEQDFSPTNCVGESLTTALDEGELAVDFTLKDTSAKSYTLTSLLTTKPVLLVFGSFT